MASADGVSSRARWGLPEIRCGGRGNHRTCLHLIHGHTELYMWREEGRPDHDVIDVKFGSLKTLDY